MLNKELDRWFAAEVLPLEPLLLRYLKRNWHDEAEVSDLCQESYIRIYDAARREKPCFAKSYLFLIARNLIIDRLRQKRIVPIVTIANFESLNVRDDRPGPEQSTAARQELGILLAALEELPPRCRQVVTLRKLEGVPQREVAYQLGITEEVVEHLVARGMQLLIGIVRARAEPGLPRINQASKTIN